MKDEEKVINEASINFEKKKYLIRTDAFGKMHVIKNFEMLQAYEDKLNKKIYEFTKEEYANLFRSFSSFREVKVSRQFFSRYIEYLSIKYDLDINNCAALTTPLKEILSLASDYDKRYITDDQFEEIMHDVSTSSIDPEYDCGIIALCYKGLSIGEIRDLKPSDINFDENTIAIEDKSIKIDTRLAYLLKKVLNLTTIHAKFNTAEPLIKDQDRVFRTYQVYSTNVSEIQFYTQRIVQRSKKMVKNKELAEKLNVSNLRFSGLFNFMQAKSKAAHYNLVEDILKDSPEHVEVYNEYLNEYRGKPSTMYNFYYFRGSYVVLANSIKNGYKYQ